MDFDDKNEINNFIKLLSKLPGLGPRSGRRAALAIIKQKDNRITLKGFNPKPSDKIAINSLSLFNFIKHNRRPKININGRITVIKFGIK